MSQLIKKDYKTVNKDQESQESKASLKNPFREAFDHSTRWLGNLLAPLIIITYIKELQQAFDFVVGHPVLTSIFALFFVVVLSLNILKNLKVQFRSRKLNISKLDQQYFQIEPKSEVEAAADQIHRPQSPQKYYKIWRWIAIVGSFVALILIIYVYVMVFVKGLYYVVVSSAPSEQSAIREVQSLNRFFEISGYSDLEARAHASTASGSPWYMISIGGWHTSEEAVEATFRRAKEAMGPRMRSDTFIYSTKNISPKRAIIGWVKKKTAMIGRIFR